MEKMTVEKGLLRETEIVQHQLTALLKCDVCRPERSPSPLLSLEVETNRDTYTLGHGQRTRE